MASNETVLKIKAQIENLEGLNQLKTALRKSSAEAKGADNDFKGLVQKVRELQSASVKSINNLNAQKDAFEALRRSVDVTSKEFKEARDEIEKIDRALKEASGTVVRYSKNSINALRAQKNELLAVRDSADLMSKEFKEAGVELAKLDKKLAKAEGRKIGGGRLRAGAQIAGTVAGAGVFGGPEGAAGAALGGIVGGVPGAVVGGAIGAQLSQIRKLGSEIATYKAEIDKLNIALRNVAGLEYADALLAITSASEDFNVPFKEATRTFTRLVAAGTANGNTVRELEGLYRGLSAATKATGGSTEDLNGVLLAATQVLSKGKVSAEELRGQIGERLPGAFSLFAQATGRTTQQLDEDLKAGAVSAEEFVTDFANFINTKYKDAAAEIADSPSEAGARLERTLKNLQVAIGPILQGIGAEFQIFANEALTALTPLLQEINKFFKLDRSGKNTRLANLEKNKIPEVEQIIRDMAGRDGDRFVGIPKAVAGIFDNPGAKRSVDYVFKQASKKLVEFRGRARQLRLELFPVAREQADLPTGERTEEEGEEKTKTKTKGPGRADFRDLEASFARRAVAEALRQDLAIRSQINEARIEGNKDLVFELQQHQKLVGINQVILSLEEQVRQRAAGIVKAQKEGFDVAQASRKQLDDKAKLTNAIAKKQDMIDEIRAETLERERGITAELDKQRKSFEAQFTDRQKELGLISSDDYKKVLLGREGERLADPDLGLSPEQQARGLDQYRQTIDPTLTEGLSQNIAKMKLELEDLVNPINQITGAANAIGGAFSQSFTDAISGSKSAKQALADFFKSVGSYFLDMAKQIIAKQIVMIIYGTIMKALGIAGGASSGGEAVNPKSLDAIQGYSGVGANTDVSGLVVGRANGGPVSANTPYIVGERGPELFVPFQQGNITSNEDLEAQMRDTRSANMAFSSSNSFQQLQSVNLPFTRNAEQSSMVAAERETAQAINNPAPINVRFESQVINGVEYVTAEQHRQGMTQAAERGRAMTLTTLQNSPRTRSKVGI